MMTSTSTPQSMMRTNIADGEDPGQAWLPQNGRHAAHERTSSTPPRASRTILPPIRTLLSQPLSLGDDIPPNSASSSSSKNSNKRSRMEYETGDGIRSLSLASPVLGDDDGSSNTATSTGSHRRLTNPHPHPLSHSHHLMDMRDAVFSRHSRSRLGRTAPGTGAPFKVPLPPAAENGRTKPGPGTRSSSSSPRRRPPHTDPFPCPLNTVPSPSVVPNSICIDPSLSTDYSPSISTSTSNSSSSSASWVSSLSMNETGSPITPFSPHGYHTFPGPLDTSFRRGGPRKDTSETIKPLPHFDYNYDEGGDEEEENDCTPVYPDFQPSETDDRISTEPRKLWELPLFRIPHK